MGSNASAIHNNLLIPFSSVRRSSNGALGTDVGVNSYLWSSSPDPAISTFSWMFALNAADFMTTGNRRAYGQAIRCVQDSYNTYAEASNSPNNSDILIVNIAT